MSAVKVGDHVRRRFGVEVYGSQVGEVIEIAERPGRRCRSQRQIVESRIRVQWEERKGRSNRTWMAVSGQNSTWVRCDEHGHVVVAAVLAEGK